MPDGDLAASGVELETQNPDAASVETTAETTQPQPVDLSEFDKKLAEATENAAAKAELDAIRRATGHIPALQSRIDAIQKALDSQAQTPRQVAALEAKVDKLVDLLAREKLIEPLNVPAAPQTDPRLDTLAERLAAIDAKLTPQEQQPADPETAAIMAGWAQAEDYVASYARSKEIDPTTIPAEAWTRAFNADQRNPRNGVTLMIAEVDALAAAKARRAERTEAGTAPVPSPATRRGPLSRDALNKMSRDEVMALTDAEIEAALAS